MTATDDFIHDRLTYEPAESDTHLQSIPFPEGLTPTPSEMWSTSTSSILPAADILVVTWTAAEWQALADVLTPGKPKESWKKYTHNWSSFENHLTWKSPAKEAQCLGECHPTDIGPVKVLCFHSQLHLATDDATAPIIALWKQIIEEVSPTLIITTGTAGGVGEYEVLGDVFVVSNAKFNCTKEFRSAPWSQTRFESVPYSAGPLMQIAQDTLIPVNAGGLKPSGYAPRLPAITVGGDVETIDSFGFDDTDDSYGIVTNDPQARTEEMDDATLWLALQEMDSSIPALSVRNASDPEVPSSVGDLEAQSKWASAIYNTYGYLTTVCSALACWAIIADHVTAN